MDDVRVAVPVLIVAVYIAWKYHLPAERRYLDRVETVTPNPHELKPRLSPGDLKDCAFSVRPGATLKDFYWGLGSMVLGLLVLGFHHRYHLIRGSPAMLVFILWAYAVYRWVRSYLTRKDRVRIRGGMIHYYRFGRLRWKLQLRQIARVDVYFEAMYRVKTTNKNASQRHLELHSNIGETFRILDYERFADADKLKLLLASGGM